MKNLIITLIIIVFSLFQMQGFGQADTVVIKKRDHDNVKHSTIEDELIGKWELKYNKSYGKWRQCRECPYIIIYDSQLATVFLDSNRTEKYKWSIDSNKIKFELAEDSINSPFFSNVVYSIMFSNRDKNLILLLFSGDLDGFAFIKK